MWGERRERDDHSDADGGGTAAVGVGFATSNGTATSGAHYTAVSQTVSFADGDTANKTVNIPILNDVLVEGNETVNVTLSSPTGGATLGSPSTAVLTITDDDVNTSGTLQLSAATYSVGEGGGTAMITVTRTGGGTGAVGIGFATSNGTATSGADYTAVSQTVSFADGDTANKTVNIPILNDVLVEGNETVNVTLSSPTGGATLGSPSTATLTITDDDANTPGTLQLSAATYSVGESVGSATITVTRTGGINGAVGIGFATSNGTATSGADYTAVSQTVSFADGDTANKTVNIPNPERRAGGGERDGQCGTEQSDGRRDAGESEHGGPGLLLDHDVNTSGTLQLSAATYSVGEGGGTATITVTRTGGRQRAQWGLVSRRRAMSGADYTAVSQTGGFADGDAVNKTVSIPILNDTLVEGNETVNLTLSSPTGGATLGTPGTAVLTIADDDANPLPTLTSRRAARRQADRRLRSPSMEPISCQGPSCAGIVPRERRHSSAPHNSRRRSALAMSQVRAVFRSRSSTLLRAAARRMRCHLRSMGRSRSQ